VSAGARKAGFRWAFAFFLAADFFGGRFDPDGFFAMLLQLRYEIGKCKITPTCDEASSTKKPGHH
jgi:hypothetical protein